MKTSRPASFAPDPPECKVSELCALPRHPTNEDVNKILHRAENVILKVQSGEFMPKLQPPSRRGNLRTDGNQIGTEDQIYANSHVDFSQTKVVGFDYDYTLVSYKVDLLHLIYDMAKDDLIKRFGYPAELTEELPGYDPGFAIRGLSVDLQTAWICKLTYNYYVSTAFFGREQVDRESLRPLNEAILSEDVRKRRLKPLNDLFSMAEACLLADVVQWFKSKRIPFNPGSVTEDVLQSIRHQHISGRMHNTVAANVERFVNKNSDSRKMLERLKASGKKLMLVSNSLFRYVDKGMRYVVGDDWRQLFDAVVVRAGKPDFYTMERPFREVSTRTDRVKYKPVDHISPNEVYCDGSISELIRITGWVTGEDGTIDGSKVLYLGDSLFADLVEARRTHGWTTGAIIEEVHHETNVQAAPTWRRARTVLQILHTAMHLCQEQMGSESRQDPRTAADEAVLNELEALSAQWRQEQDACMSPNFGSIFRAAIDWGSTPSLFAISLRRYVDIYTSRVENLYLYSTDHRFYPSMAHMGIPHESTHMTDSILSLLIDSGGASSNITNEMTYLSSFGGSSSFSGSFRCTVTYAVIIFLVSPSSH